MYESSCCLRVHSVINDFYKGNFNYHYSRRFACYCYDNSHLIHYNHNTIIINIAIIIAETTIRKINTYITFKTIDTNAIVLRNFRELSQLNCVSRSIPQLASCPRSPSNHRG